ncbi:LOW QUALITY PROTEIN: carboxypeptidase Q-like [Dermacentor silvarum]|uniref:LOW QUALITY PROTEIN: carboxypeptidase Q-like n=1 Tax=Dermacentor silvarum TaxID=543639 RepID=UPI0021016E01|nr:LOW QUALITY PROTEIN: carboxypeptidase Q-like [Dermacentor silvarum]
MVVHGDEQNVTYEELATFVDTFGARPSGSKSLEDSIDYMLDVLRMHGLDSVHAEKAGVINWQRGHEEAWMMEPRMKRMDILGLGNSVPTPAGGITAPVLVVGSFKELEKKSRQGKIVVFNQEYVSYEDTVNYRTHGATAAAKAGAVAALVRSVTPLSINSPHTGYMEYDENTTRIPAASITVEDSELFARLQARGIEPVVKLVMRAKLLPPAVSRNTIAEIRGKSKPEEVVLLSGHLDSWDVGQGAMDDGAGAFISWRALAVLRRLGLKPRRTLRCVLWTGEEQGITGALDYFRRHFAREHHLMNLVMESDSGTFRPLGLGFSGSNGRARCIVAEVLRLFASINATQLALRASEADVSPWNEKGVPALSLSTANDKYFYFHHTEADTMSVLDRHELDLCTALWAAASYVFADLTIRLPR